MEFHVKGKKVYVGDLIKDIRGYEYVYLGITPDGLRIYTRLPHEICEDESYPHHFNGEIKKRIDKRVSPKEDKKSA